MSHANAPLTPEGRRRLASAVVDEGWPVRRAAERFQVSPATASKWAATKHERCPKPAVTVAGEVTGSTEARHPTMLDIIADMASADSSDSQHDQPAFNEVIHSPIRLQVCAILAEADSLRFAEVQSTLGITDSHLSKNIRVLAAASLVTQSKQYEQTAEHQLPVTVLALTAEGRRVYRHHATWLAQITHGITGPQAEPR